jgi:hypothetical protein
VASSSVDLFQAFRTFSTPEFRFHFSERMRRAFKSNQLVEIISDLDGIVYVRAWRTLQGADEKST